MSSPSFAPGARPRPAAPARRPAPRRVPWGWAEWFLIAQTFIPALLFVPGISSGRVVIRIAVFMVAIGSWSAVIWSGRSSAAADSFSATFWLKLVIGWLALSIFHWNTNSIPSGVAQAMLYIAVLSPAFWAPRVLSSPRQLGRLMTILLLCNGLSALVGLGQVFRPATFNPPVIPGIATDEASLANQGLAFTDQAGRRILRPCGLSDQVGAAAGGGLMAALIGLAYALRPIGVLRRLACIALAFGGVAVIYYSQVRTILVMLVICLTVLAAIFSAQKNYGYAALLGGHGAAMIAGALSWVAATSGRVVVERFLGLADRPFSESYESSGRAGFVRYALQEQIWDAPLGGGLGHWGTMYSTFGDKSKPSSWVEVMIPGWISDGGIPLLLFYNLAIVLAMADTFRIALRSRDREVAFWAAVVFASNLSIIATCFSYVTFCAAIGLQFWFLAGVVHAADYRVRQAAARARQAAARPSPAPPPRPPSPYPTAPASP